MPEDDEEEEVEDVEDIEEEEEVDEKEEDGFSCSEEAECTKRHTA